ncbi:hypothetical protein H1R20_g318, partial [Candolleomyces eurysporus]
MQRLRAHREKLEQELEEVRSQSGVEPSLAVAADQAREPGTPTQVIVQLATPTNPPTTLDPEQGDGEEDGEGEDDGARSELGAKAESVATAYTEISADIENRLDKMLLKRAQKVELEDRLKELKNKGADPAVIENAEKVLSKFNRKIQRLYEDSRKEYVYWAKAPEQITLAVTPTVAAENRVREGILLHLTPDSKSFKFQLTLPFGKGGGAARIKKAMNSFLRDTMNILPTASDPNNARELRIEITEDEFEEWVLDYRQRNVKAGGDS